MLSSLCLRILKTLGWSLHIELPETGKYVLIVAPHTSNWDFPLGILAGKALKLEPRWMGKHTIFRWPFGWFFRALGGIPVQRDRALNTIQQMADLLVQSEKMVLALAPEGTRVKKNYWKTGFYHIAVAAEVPIAMAYLDYPRKRVGLGGTFYPCGDVDQDFARIAGFYIDRRGKYPEQEGLIRARRKK